MSTEKRQSGRQAEPPAPEGQDPLGIMLAETIYKCCEEMGVSGCSICPVEGKCKRLWEREVVDIKKITPAEYRQLDRKFAHLRQERDGILARRREKAALRPTAP